MYVVFCCISITLLWMDIGLFSIFGCYKCCCGHSCTCLGIYVYELMLAYLSKNGITGHREIFMFSLVDVAKQFSREVVLFYSSTSSVWGSQLFCVLNRHLVWSLFLLPSRGCVVVSHSEFNLHFSDNEAVYFLL